MQDAEPLDKDESLSLKTDTQGKKKRTPLLPGAWEQSLEDPAYSKRNFGQVFVRFLATLLTYIFALGFIPLVLMLFGAPLNFTVAVIASIVASILAVLVSVPQMRTVGERATRKIDLRDWIGARNFRWGSSIGGFVTGVIYLVVTQAVFIILQTNTGIEFSSSETSVGMGAQVGFAFVFVTLIFAPLAAPVIEEVLFRGVLRNQLTMMFASFKNWAHVPAIIISSLLFAFAHYQGFSSASDFAVLIVPFFTGVFTSLWVLRSKSIYPAILFHAGYNISTTALMLLL